MPPKIRGHCRLCAKPVRVGETAAFRVRGWEIERQAGGANQILGRERQPDRIYHAVCVQAQVEKAKRGLIGQESLL